MNIKIVFTETFVLSSILSALNPIKCRWVSKNQYESIIFLSIIAISCLCQQSFLLRSAKVTVLFKIQIAPSISNFHPKLLSNENFSIALSFWHSLNLLSP